TLLTLLTLLSIGLHKRTMSSAGTLHKRLGPIKGANDCVNEIIYSSPTKDALDRKRKVTVFFGGDVQDYPEAMQSHRDHGQYVEWSLTNVSELLAQKFPTQHIIVIKPKRMEIKTFSCYDNFVQSNNIGAPTHEPWNNSLIHLRTLITEALNAAENCNFENKESDLIKASIADNCEQSEQSGKCEVNSCDKDQDVTEESKMSCDGEVLEYDEVNLIGFSKGCVVLNQLIQEMNTLTRVQATDSSGLSEVFCKKISNMYWLDGGHSGGKETWITNREVLTSLAGRKHIKIYIHVTPYQVQDDQRPWIRRESKAFFDILRRNGALVSYKLHFQEEIPSLYAHFRLLKEFVNDK
ncbi:unnamed protein product, partial [Meganyctiphanes norvegica]